MKPFRERNVTIIGLIGLAIIAALMLGSFRADKLPIIGSGDTYQACQSEFFHFDRHESLLNSSVCKDWFTAILYFFRARRGVGP